MIKIAVYSLKGGVGKTITAANLGHLYATHRTKKIQGDEAEQLTPCPLGRPGPAGELVAIFQPL